LLAALQVLDRSPVVADRRARARLLAMHELSVSGRWLDLLPIAERAWHGPPSGLPRDAVRLAAVLGTSLLMSGRVDEANTLLATEAARLERSGRAAEAPSLLVAAAAAALNAGHLSRSRHLCALALPATASGTRHFARCLEVATGFRSDRDR